MITEQISADENAGKNERQSANWDLQNAFRNYSTLVVTQIAVAFFSFASVWLATRYLGTEGYGGIVAVIAASQIAQIFVNWTALGLARFGVEEFVENGRINKSFWARNFILLPNTILLLATSILWVPLVSSWLKLPAEAGWYIVAYFAAMTFWFHVQNALQGAKLPRLQGVLLVVERFLIFLVLLILVMTGKINYLSALLAYIIAPLLASIAGLFQLRKLISWRVEFDLGWLKKMLSFSIPLIPFSIVGYFSSTYIDAIFISQYLPKSELGVYSVAYQIAGILMQFPLLAGSLLMPLFVTLRTNKQEETVNKYMQDVLPVVTLIWGLGCVLFAVCTAYLLPLVFGVELARSSDILLILAISSAVNAPILLGYAPFINAVSATYISTVLNVALALTNLVGNFILIPKYGLIGAAWATNLGYGASLLVTFALVHYKFPLRRVWTLQALVPIILSLAAASWTGSLLLALVTVLLSTFLLTLLHRKSIRQSIEFLSNFRNYLSSG